MGNHRLHFSQPAERGAVSSVLVASGYARRLVETEARRSGTSKKDAIKAVARQLREPPGSIWGLLFRLPKRINAELLLALEVAVEREIQREIKALEHELATLRATGRGTAPGALAEVEEGLARLRATMRGGTPHG